MDFPLEEAIRAGLAHSDARDGWDDQDKRISQVYHVLAQDMYYADVNNVLVFIGNHDMDHIADMVADNVETITAERAKQIIEMNRRGEKPESLQEGGKQKPQKMHVDLAAGDISRFDKAKKKKKKKNKNNNRPNDKKEAKDA